MSEQIKSSTRFSDDTAEIIEEVLNPEDLSRDEYIYQEQDTFQTDRRSNLYSRASVYSADIESVSTSVISVDTNRQRKSLSQDVKAHPMIFDEEDLFFILSLERKLKRRDTINRRSRQVETMARLSIKEEKKPEKNEHCTFKPQTTSLSTELSKLRGTVWNRLEEDRKSFEKRTRKLWKKMLKERKESIQELPNSPLKTPSKSPHKSPSKASSKLTSKIPSRRGSTKVTSWNSPSRNISRPSTSNTNSRLKKIDVSRRTPIPQSHSNIFNDDLYHSKAPDFASTSKIENDLEYKPTLTNKDQNEMWNEWNGNNNLSVNNKHPPHLTKELSSNSLENDIQNSYDSDFYVNGNHQLKHEEHKTNIINSMDKYPKSSNHLINSIDANRKSLEHSSSNYFSNKYSKLDKRRNGNKSRHSVSHTRSSHSSKKHTSPTKRRHSFSANRSSSKRNDTQNNGETQNNGDRSLWTPSDLIRDFKLILEQLEADEQIRSEKKIKQARNAFTNSNISLHQKWIDKMNDMNTPRS